MIYDIVFITNVPAFYKINLYHSLAQHLNIYVIFMGSQSVIRTNDFNSQPISFPHTFLNQCPFEVRSILSTSIKLASILKPLNYKKIILGGWDLPEYWLVRSMHKKQQLCLALESGQGESKATGLKASLKKYFLNKISEVFASGTSHQALLKTLSYHGKCRITQGVGLFNPLPVLPKNTSYQGRFLYLGRLSEEKNLIGLLDVFNMLDQFTLTIVGNGPLLTELKSKAPERVCFESHIPNDQLSELFQRHDVLILPSLREPWGLVVEEALYHGLPVIVSRTAGCAELIERHQCGYLIDPTLKQDIYEKIMLMEENYLTFRKNIEMIDFNAREHHQIAQYVQALT